MSNYHNKTKSQLIKEIEELQSQIKIFSQSKDSHAEVKYRSIFKHSGAPAIIIAFDMTILMANPKFEELTGFSKQEIEGKLKWHQFVAPKDQEKMKLYHRLRRTKGGNAPEEYECQIIIKNREIKDILMKVGMIPGSQLSIASFSDITSRKKAEAALLESERRLSTLMGNLPGMAYRCIYDDEWTMEFLSEGCFDLTGFHPEALIGNRLHNFGDLIHEEDKQNARKAINDALLNKKSYELIYRINTASNDKKWVWDKGVGVFSSQRKLLALEGFITDFTAQKNVEQVLLRENIRLRSSMKDRYQFGNIIGKSVAMQKVYKLILKASDSDANVIIYGESGTGKELAARAIHDISDRSSGKFVPVNCGAIPENLFESEFFGYEKGAFSGADKTRQGYLDAADNGTLFLDELGEINHNMQVKLLRAIEGSGYTPLGSMNVKQTNIRIVAATNKNLQSLVKNGKMREDFFYRIHIIPICLPPLRERKEDIPLLVDYFLSQYNKDKKKAISGKILDALNNYHWPGNVRELQNVVHRYVTLNRIDFIDSSASEINNIKNDHKKKSKNLQVLMEDFEKTLILKALEKNRWHREETAKNLGISRRTFFRKLKKFNLTKA